MKSIIEDLGIVGIALLGVFLAWVIATGIMYATYQPLVTY